MKERYLFRGKRTKNGEWVCGNLAYNRNSTCQISDTDQDIAWWEWVDPATVGQCTGLKDKNGKLIFEGDVLTATEYPFQENGKHNYNAIVRWFENAAQFGYELQCVNPDKQGISNGICEGFGGRDALWEIIGNIHEQEETE